MIGRRILLALAIVSGTLSGALYLAAAQRVDVVVAARDVDPPRPLGAADLAVRSVSADLSPEGALAAIDDAIGRTPSTPLLRGQLVLRRALADDAPAFGSGISLPLGMRAIALPVTAAEAVGGTVRPGATVDVLAVPIQGRAPPERATELLASGVLVLDVRSESGASLTETAATPLGVAGDRIGSVVIAVRASDALWVADRIATSTFVIALGGR